MLASADAEELDIFHTQVGDGPRAYDPFRVDRLLSAALAGERLGEVVKAAKCPVPALSGPATDKLLAAASAAFGLPALADDGTGHTERTRLRVLGEYLRWRDAVKKKRASSPTSAPAGAPASSGGPSPRRSATDCGCTGAAPDCSRPPR